VIVTEKRNSGWVEERKNETNLLHEPMLDIHQNLPAISVALDEHVQRITVLHPSKQTRSWRKRCNGELLDTEMPLGTFLVGAKKGIDETEELHDSLVLTQVFVSCRLAPEPAEAASNLPFKRYV